jgi:hypothetical protein
MTWAQGCSVRQPSVFFVTYVVPAIAKPELPVLLTPDFVWPDTATTTVYEASTRTANPRTRAVRAVAKSLAPTRLPPRALVLLKTCFRTRAE